MSKKVSKLQEELDSLRRGKPTKYPVESDINFSSVISFQKPKTVLEYENGEVSPKIKYETWYTYKGKEYQNIRDAQKIRNSDIDKMIERIVSARNNCNDYIEKYNQLVSDCSDTINDLRSDIKTVTKYQELYEGMLGQERPVGDFPAAIHSCFGCEPKELCTFYTPYTYIAQNYSGQQSKYGRNFINVVRRFTKIL